jgi:tyrosinase
MAYRNPGDATNSLFHERSMNDGSLLPPQIVVDDVNTALGQTAFEGFSPSFEGSPHGQVHVLVGGDMQSVPTSARDPLFWLHHCNIDRNWDRWLNLGGGRLNPADSSWLDVPYSYPDENGQTVTVKVSDIVSSAALGYRYDDVPNPAAMAIPRPEIVAAAAPAPVHRHAGEGHDKKPTPGTVVASSESAGAALEAAQPPKRLGFAPATIKLEAVALVGAPMEEAVAAAHPSRPGRISLDVQGMSVAATPSFTYDVYLNLPEGEVAPERMRMHRVGSINFFGKGANAGHKHASPTFDQTLDATATVAHLRELGAWNPKQITVTLRPVTAIAPQGKEEAARARAVASAEAAKIHYKSVSLRVLP